MKSYPIAMIPPIHIEVSESIYGLLILLSLQVTGEIILQDQILLLFEI